MTEKEPEKPAIELIQLEPEVEQRLLAEHYRDCPDNGCYGHDDKKETT